MPESRTGSLLSSIWKANVLNSLSQHVHWFNLTDAVVLHILANNKNRLSFVFQFSTYMTTRGYYRSCLNEGLMDGVDHIHLSRPLRQSSHQLLPYRYWCHTWGSQTIDDDQTYFHRIYVKSIINKGYSQFGCIFTQSPEHKARIIFFWTIVQTIYKYVPELVWQWYLLCSVSKYIKSSVCASGRHAL